MPDLRGKTVVVTGAGGGIGRAACVRLAQDGANIAALDVVEETARDTVGGMEGSDVRAVSLPCDVADEDSVRAAVAAAVEHLGPATPACSPARRWPPRARCTNSRSRSGNGCSAST